MTPEEHLTRAEKLIASEARAAQQKADDADMAGDYVAMRSAEAARVAYMTALAHISRARKEAEQ